MMKYSWNNDELWQLKISQEDFKDFEQPYIGNGIIGTKFDKLVVGTDRLPLWTLSRSVYDGGQQLLVPAWNHIFLEVGGVAYKPEDGKHQLEQVLDIRNAVVTMVDRWEYVCGKTITIYVEMFIPRTFGHASYLSFSIENLDDTANLRFGILGNTLTGDLAMNFSHEDESIMLGDYCTPKQNRHFSQAIKWKCSGMNNVSTHISENNMEVSTSLSKGDVKLELIHALRSYRESSDTRKDVIERVKQLSDIGRDELFKTNSEEWMKLWRSGIAFRNNDFNKEKCILVHQFYYLCTLEVCDYPLGPLGLSNYEWCGSQLWDADVWTFRAILPLWPGFARSIVDFRRKTLDAAREHAWVSGYEGAWYPCLGDDDGRNNTPARYNDELHVNIWIARAAWEYYLTTGDMQFLSNTGWPIISSISDFFSTRVEIGSDGQYHLNCVLGPDESVCECGQLRVNDNFLTNYGVKKLLQTACIAADVLGVKANQQWKKVGDNLFLVQPDAYGIIPEYSGYNGHGIKQADVILTFYPLGYEPDPEIIHRNIKFYRDKQMYYGPLMSSQIESCIMMKHGEKEKGMKRLFDGMAEFTRGSHFIPFECRDNDKSIMLTGIGGELQALIYGYYGADLNSFDKLPRIAQYMD